MKKAFNAHNFIGVGSEAHQLKSSSAILGVMKLAHLFSKIEEASIEKHKSNTEKFLTDIEKEFLKVEWALGKVLAGRDRKSA